MCSPKANQLRQNKVKQNTSQDFIFLPELSTEFPLLFQFSNGNYYGSSGSTMAAILYTGWDPNKCQLIAFWGHLVRSVVQQCHLWWCHAWALGKQFSLFLCKCWNEPHKSKSFEPRRTTHIILSISRLASIETLLCGFK